MEAVIEDAANEVIRLEQLMEDMLSDDPDSPLLDDIYEKLDSLDPSTIESRAAHILYGIGFTQARMGLMCKVLHRPSCF